MPLSHTGRANVDYTNEHGHPTQAALDNIKNWPSDREHWQRDLLAFVQSLWWPEPGYGWRRVHHPGGEIEVVISSAGAKCNEELLAALQAHTLFWVTCWEWSRRSGTYSFRVR